MRGPGSVGGTGDLTCGNHRHRSGLKVPYLAICRVDIHFNDTFADHIVPDADITVYTPHENKQQMFELPRYVIKSGRVIVEEGEIRENFIGKTLHVGPEYDRDIEEEIGQWFEDYYSIRFRNYPVSDDYLHAHEQVACAASDEARTPELTDGPAS